jgi:hypothetical protein
MSLKRPSIFAALIGMVSTTRQTLTQSRDDFGWRFLEGLFTRIEQRSASWTFEPWDRTGKGDPDVAA